MPDLSSGRTQKNGKNFTLLARNVQSRSFFHEELSGLKRLFKTIVPEKAGRSFCNPEWLFLRRG
jgi:hypothetical protein